jgi:hypothetical protein
MLRTGPAGRGDNAEGHDAGRSGTDGMCEPRAKQACVLHNRSNCEVRRGRGCIRSAVELGRSPPTANAASVSLARREKAWNDCVYEELCQKEVLKPPTSTAIVAASAIAEQCRRFSVGSPERDEFIVYTFVSQLRAKGPAREPRPVSSSGGDLRM